MSLVALPLLAVLPFAASAPLAGLGPISAAPPASSAAPVGESLAVSADEAPACSSSVRLSMKSRTLQKNLEAALARSKLDRYTKKHSLSVAVVDLSDADETYYAGINDDEMVYAASLPKIAILLTVVEHVARGKLAWTSEFDRRLSAMITESSNPDATWGAEIVGLKAIEAEMRDPRYCLYDEVHGGLWVGRPYGRGNETNRDPLFSLSHGATARQAARFYAMLHSKELVSKEWSQRLLKLMGPPKHHHKFVGGLKGRKDVTFIARKSGSWRSWHADSALIQHGEQRYVIVGLSELKHGEQVMQELARLVDDIVMDGKYRKPKGLRS